MEKLISKLAFLKGSWSGDSFVVDFTDPVYTMMFGSMQKAADTGEVVHWETYRFEEKDQHVFLYSSQMGEESGVYVLSPSEPNATGYVFEAFINKQLPVQEIYFKPLERNDEQILFGIKGKVEGRSFEKEWLLRRRTAPLQIS
ncbi:hypothetical protein QA612_15405 [Evansella sp. AB-P1]|uniref:hypothetical protein n=1 Tax=Evansella sp. AB-P1 TaxID=3037653 RepID=UPI00241D2BCE|nr:hypothetical protein [Evansella sp. AB-P1]MDG5788858.1 hypothetical protein [Evansella sp. AB-P1]